MQQSQLGRLDRQDCEQVFDVHGVVKWYDAVKGYGFVIPNGGGDDVLLHHSVLQPEGISFLLEGTSVHCRAVQRAKGVQVISLVSLDTSTAQPMTASNVDTIVPIDAGDADLVDTRVKWFNRVRGFGFVSEGDEAEDIFIHMEILRQAGILTVQPGDHLRVRVGEGNKGLQATAVMLVDH